MHKLRCLKEATELYQMVKKIRLRPFMKDQLLRATSSIALNLSEGNARRTLKDKRRFFNIAYASTREVQTICTLEGHDDIFKKADHIGGMIFCLCRKLTEAVTETETETAIKNPNASKTS
jgi:four helix bundle protein